MIDLQTDEMLLHMSVYIQFFGNSVIVIKCCNFYNNYKTEHHGGCYKPFLTSREKFPFIYCGSNVSLV